MRYGNRWAWVILFVLGLQVSGCAQKAASASVPAARIEPIEGSDLKRVVLTDRAIQRLGLQTVPVREEAVTRKRAVGGQIVALGGRVLARVRLNSSDLQVVDASQAARVFPLGGEEYRAAASEPPASADGKSVVALPLPRGDAAGGAPGQRLSPQAPDAITPLDWVVDGLDHGLSSGQAVMVELSLLGREGPRTVIPSSAVLYDVGGQTWIYTNPEPLVFIRHRIVADYIEGDLAVLSDGPPAGTSVVKVGATELFGAEVRVGK